MSGGKEVYEKTIAKRQFRPIAMQVLAPDALQPKVAFEYVCKQDKIQSILFGASSRKHIQDSIDLINSFNIQ